MNANLAVLEHDLEDAIATYARRREHNRRRSRTAAVLTASLAAVTTVLIGLANTWTAMGTLLSSLAIVTSAVTGIISAEEALFSHKKLWILYTDKWIALLTLRDDIKHAKANGETTQDMVNSLYERYKAIRNDLNKEWRDLRSASV